MDDPYFGAILIVLAFPAALIGLGLLAALCRIATWAARAIAVLLGNQEKGVNND